MMNSERVQRALATVGSPQKLVNLVGCRVRQLSSKSQTARPLIEEAHSLQQLDIALEEIIQGKITYECYDLDDSNRQIPRKPTVLD